MSFDRCLINNVVYKATVRKEGNDNDERIYIVFKVLNCKNKLCNHNLSFTNKNTLIVLHYQNKYEK